jgi:hypothetical protein
LAPRERLIDALWAESPPPSDVAAPQTAPEGTIVTRPTGHTLEGDPETIDLRQFGRLVAEAHGVAPDAAARLLRVALALWRGPPLTVFGDEAFLRAEAGEASSAPSPNF